MPGGGIINTNINTEDPTESIVGFTPGQITVDPATQTVQGQIEGIIAADSPLMQQAATTARQGMNQRGLLNSSMAIGAGQDAVIRQALPIAQQDAGTFYDANKTNVGAENQALEFTAGAQNTGAGQVLAGDQQIKAIEATGEETRETIGTQTAAESGLMAEKAAIDQALLTAEGEQRAALLAQQGDINYRLQVLQGSQAIEQALLAGDQALALQTLQGQQAIRLANVEGRWKTLTQANQAAGAFFTQISSDMTRILADPEIPVAQKQQLIDQQLELLEAGLTVIGAGGNVDFASLLDFGP